MTDDLFRKKMIDISPDSNDDLDQKLDLKSFGVPFLIIYVVSDVDSVFYGSN